MNQTPSSPRISLKPPEVARTSFSYCIALQNGVQFKDSGVPQSSVPWIVFALQTERLEVLHLAEEHEVGESHPAARDEFPARLVELLL